jgi:hypothetical protein
LTKEELATRNDLVAALPERIQSIPDGTTQPKQSGSWFGSGSRPTNEIKFDSGSYTFHVDFELFLLVLLLRHFEMGL